MKNNKDLLWEHFHSFEKVINPPHFEPHIRGEPKSGNRLRQPPIRTTRRIDGSDASIYQLRNVTAKQIRRK